MSVRACAARLARVESKAAARFGQDPQTPDLVVVAVDASGVGRLSWVCGPFGRSPSGAWPPEAYGSFRGDEVDLHAYYARHGWQPARTVVLCPEPGSERFCARNEAPR